MGSLPLAGMTALVTGGAGGLGSACATRLARDGAGVTLMGRTAASLRAVAERITAECPDAPAPRIFVGDAMTSADVAAAVDAACGPDGTLNICVATVGGGVLAPLLARTEQDFLEELRRNVVAPFLAIKYSTPKMASGGGGSIVCISSDAAKLTFLYMIGYCAGKAAVDQLVRAAADELGELGIRVNAVRPGLTKTNSENITKLFADPEMVAEFERQKPLGRTGVPTDIAEGVRFLAGPESAWITGQSLAIEGGNELRQAPNMEKVVRARVGDAVMDAARAGRIPDGY